MTAVVLETGAGVPGADTYVEASDVSTYILDHYGAAAQTTWDGQAEPDRLLRTGCAYIDLVYHSRWPGIRANESQGMDHPRLNMEDSDGYVISSTIVHQSVKDAACEAIYRAQTTTLLPDETDPNGGIVEESLKIASLAIGTKYSNPGQTSQPRFSIIDRILSPLLGAGETLERA